MNVGQLIQMLEYLDPSCPIWPASDEWDCTPDHIRIDENDTLTFGENPYQDDTISLWDLVNSSKE